MTKVIGIRQRRGSSTKKYARSLVLFVSLIALTFIPTRKSSVFEIILAVEASDTDKHRHYFPLPSIPFQETSVLDNEKSLALLLGQLDDFVENSVSYLVKISHSAQQDSKFPGRFTYQADTRVSLGPSLKQNFWSHIEQPNYNILRHNAAVYALAQVYHRSANRNSKQGDTSSTQTVILKTMENAIGYLRDNALLPVPGHNEEWLAAWERTDPNDPQSEPDTAKLGGAGLALIAMGEMEAIRPHSMSMEKELRKLGAFIESLQNKETGEFTCKYKWGIGPYDKDLSLHQPGEAALGMVTLAELELAIEDQERHKMVTSIDLELEHQQYKHHFTRTKESYSQRWIQVASNALLYLERFRRDLNLQDIEPDHWALLATAKLLPILDRLRNEKSLESHERKQADLEYSLIYSHGVKVAHSIVADHTTKGLKHYNGCFTFDERTCPTSMRLEGLLAAMTFIQDSELFLGDEEDATELLKDRIERDVTSGIRFLLKAQVKTDFHNMKGAVPGKFTTRKLSPPPLDSNDDGHKDDEDFDYAEVRIDYVQHSMSAVMAYEQFLLEKIEANHSNKAFHKRVHENVHKAVRDVKHKIHKAASSSVFVNYAILATVWLVVIIVICLAYLPWAWIPILGRSKRRRRFKRKD